MISHSKENTDKQRTHGLLELPTLTTKQCEVERLQLSWPSTSAPMAGKHRQLASKAKAAPKKNPPHVPLAHLNQKGYTTTTCD
ncbi:hypothetical protein KIN20_010919 [Parelaphostrongylus tenuis]|uniref:Uncharacterized protein n=1 Tax=Parelaphostrongylus tenuis TaxID=148309 RepID=A0AAD5QPH4_PARTN|nr:hypothetical protein KIN20_010919 [Parelaphostrongylus tenuis]